MKTTTRNTTTFHIDQLDLDVELDHKPSCVMDYIEPLIRITDKDITIGYLVDDQDCENPLDDDYMGHIYECRRHGPTLKDYERALGLSAGEPDWSLVDYGTAEQQLEWWKAGRENGTIGDPYAVLLDVYEHSSISYSLYGGGMQCQWDTAPCGAVFVPTREMAKELDEMPRDEALIKVRLWAKQAAETYTSWCNGDCYIAVVVSYDLGGSLIEDDSCGGYIGAEHAFEALKQML